MICDCTYVDARVSCNWSSGVIRYDLNCKCSSSLIKRMSTGMLVCAHKFAVWCAHLLINWVLSIRNRMVVLGGTLNSAV